MSNFNVNGSFTGVYNNTNAGIIVACSNNGSFVLNNNTNQTDSKNIANTTLKVNGTAFNPRPSKGQLYPRGFK